MDVFDLALDSGDEEWFKHLHEIQNYYNNYPLPFIQNTVKPMSNQREDNGIASFTNLPEIDANISQMDIINHLKYWNVSNMTHMLTQAEGKFNDRSMLEAMEIFIRDRRRFYIEESLESEDFGD